MKYPKCPDCGTEMVQVPVELYMRGKSTIPFFAYACTKGEIFQFAVEASTMKEEGKNILLRRTNGKKTKQTN